MLQTQLILLLLSGLSIFATAKIAPSLQEKLDNGERVNILVSFNGDITEECRLPPESRSALERGLALSSIRDNLIAKMEGSQSGVLELLATRSATSPFTQFWISNQILVNDADSSLIEAIAEDPQVAQIIEEPVIELFQEPNEGNDPEPPNGEPQPNLHQVKVPEAWELLDGNKGEGIIIGFMDTGVRGTHETLRDNFVGDFGWFDPTDMKSEPWDPLGHGTYVTGFALGNKGIGVAPGAKWSACRICRDAYQSCTLGDVMKCAQFFTCPTDVNGENHDCSKAPHIINNSWGGKFDGSTTYFDSLWECWKAAGIMPVFAIGNYGRDCGTAQYPGTIEDIIGVGNAYFEDKVAPGSSRGPTPDGRIKPDLVAPGAWLLGASANGDEDYENTRVGTSFAAPHVSGAIALLLARHSDLSYDQVKDLLIGSVDQIGQDDPDSEPCGDVPLDVFPNNLAGHGRLNVLKLIQMADAAVK